MDGPTRVLLIKPYTNVRPAIIDVPIGPLYLLSYLRHYLAGAVDTKFIDLRLSRHRRAGLVSVLTGFSPQVVGISLLTFNRAFLDTYLPVIRAHAPGALIVVGGPYATYHYADILDRHREVDVAVIGEGERVFFNLVRTVIEEGDVQSVKGIACRGADAVVCNEREPYIEDLDAIPFPDYDAIDIRRYWGNHPEMNGVLAKKAYTHIISSRACPYHCVYCHNIFGKKVRKRSPENFVAEIERLYHRYGVREFQIIDDIFNIDRPRMHDILRRIMASGMKIKIAFPNGLRGDLLTHEDIDLLQAAGAYMITLAIETASTRMQKIIRKHLDISRVMDNIAYAADRGLIVKGYFMIGFPGETVEEMKQTIDLAVKSKLDLAHFFTVIPFEGTELAEMARALYPDVGREVATHYLPARPFYQEATGYNLNRLQKTAYLRFYVSFRTVRTFLKMPRKLHRLQRWAAFALDVFRA
ncbi:MAG: radical SAM protein [Thermodesulfobacteriota bacterium]|nr:radical SAM protein [Thermodesulfobacteriota bacterium]